MNNMLQTVKQKLMLSVMACAILMSPSAFANYIIVRVDGMYCGTCLGGTVGQVKRLSGVGSVDVWLGSGILAITPNGNVDVNQIKSVIDHSGYSYVATYSCATKTDNVGSCKKM
jgi:copper chaperone CopZ